jgi:hypothetical protein
MTRTAFIASRNGRVEKIATQLTMKTPPINGGTQEARRKVIPMEGSIERPWLTAKNRVPKINANENNTIIKIPGFLQIDLRSALRKKLETMQRTV